MKPLTIGKVAKHAGIGIETVRFYEREGLLNKQTTGERPLCYCFGHSIASIKEELRTKGRSGALEEIRQKMKDPGCRCETENPPGSCCLGSVTKGIKTAQEELGMSDATVVPTGETKKTPSHRGETIAKVGTVISAIMMTVNKAMLWAVTAMAVAFLFFPSYVGAFLGGDGPAVTESMNRSIFAIEGMTCEGCSAIVAKAIGDVPDVLAAEVSYENTQVVVGSEASRAFPNDAVLKAIEDAGYSGSILQRRTDDK